jgi:hypothetical protein
VRLSGVDDHLLLTDLPGGIAEDGTGQGYQLEALLSYRLSQFSSVGIGDRYWTCKATANGIWKPSAGRRSR